MVQDWPIRQPRSVENKLTPNKALTTGQRVIDTFFPIAKGGAGCVPGPFGSGKTVIQHAFAKWSDADVIILEGSQSAHLSNYNGDYPYCTSRDSTVASLCSQIGIGIRLVD